MPRTEKKYFIIVIDSGEEIEMREVAYKALIKDFKDGRVPTQVSFADISGREYIEQRSNIRMRETQEVIY